MDIQLVIIVLVLILTVIGMVWLWAHSGKEKEVLRRQTEEMKKKAVQANVLAELTKRIGYTFDVEEIIEVISGSLH